MYIIFGNSNVALYKEVGKVNAPKIAKIGSLRKTFLFLDLRVSKNILHIG